MKVVTIVGARPQFVKAAVVSRAMAGRDGFREVIVHTGQHYDHNMSKVFFEEMHIPTPVYNLNIGSGSHGAQTGRMLEAVEGVLLDERPDILITYGDTNSTLAGALAAVKLHVPVAHVEAGLRSFNNRMPEEINRKMADHVSTILFCPTVEGVRNLRAEGIEDTRPARRVLLVGDVMYDAALYYRRFAQKPSFIDERTISPPFALVTLHRAENTDDPERFQSIMKALCEISRNTPVVFAVHPRTRRHLQGLQIADTKSPVNGIHLVDPVSYLEMLWLLGHCGMVLTDSGGLQKEAFFFGKPCVTLRDETEWTELVAHGVNMIAGSNTAGIVNACDTMKRCVIDPDLRLYGDGNAGGKIVDALLDYALGLESPIVVLEEARNERIPSI